MEGSLQASFFEVMRHMIRNILLGRYGFSAAKPEIERLEFSQQRAPSWKPVGGSRRERAAGFRLPLAVLPLLRFPSDSLFSGGTPAQPDSLAGDPKRPMSMPILANFLIAEISDSPRLASGCRCIPLAVRLFKGRGKKKTFLGLGRLSRVPQTDEVPCPYTDFWNSFKNKLEL
jgi:hypothetical protein